MAREQPGSKPAKMVYRPVGFAASMAANRGSPDIPTSLEARHAG